MPEAVFVLPDLGEGLTEAEIVEWRVAVGDPVRVDQVVVEVETAKAAVEVPVPYAGTVAVLHAEPGSTLPVGAPLVTIDSTVDSAGERYRQEERAGSGNVLVGYGTAHGPNGGSRRARRRAAQPPTRNGDAPRVISPLVRKLARDHGIDVARVVPSGPGGIVLRRDVEEVIKAPTPAPDADVERIPLRGLRRTVAERVSRSRTEIPDATTWVDVDATELLAARDVLRAVEPRIGVLALLARVCVAGLRAYPILNSTVDVERQAIVRSTAIHLGFAAQTDRGLVVPVVRDAHRLSTVELAGALARLTEMARAGTLTPEQLTGGTFTLNNYGVFGVDGSTPIINHPEAALLGVGRIVDKPWVVDGALAVRKVGQLSFTFDHRVCDGGTAGGFLRYVADCVEHPTRLLADL